MVMKQLYNLNNGTNERYLCWDEENRLSATRDNNYVTANIYDASGNRSWKLAGEMNWMWQNGSGWQGYGDLNLRTWYQSELMTITDVGFTKHYFIAGQKIASKIGASLPQSDDLPQLKEKPLAPLYRSYEELGSDISQRLSRDFDCLGVNYSNFSPGEARLTAIDELLLAEQVREDDIYFYHSDHLGSSSFLTDGGGVATQHLQYTRTELVECVPFGEDFGWSLSPVEGHQQNTAAYYTPYTFSGKERDMETGLSYFGARYYDAGLSIWLSVDPMSDKYPSLSAYNYCAWNPVMLVDPDGRFFISPSKKYGNRTSYTAHATNPEWIKQIDKMSVIPVIGIAFDIAKYGATKQDPSFNLSNSDKGGFAFDIITSLSVGIIKKSTDLAGLGLKMLEGSREISSATLSLLGNSETFEVGLDNLTFQAMAELGLGKFYKDEKGEQMTNKFVFNDNVIQNIEAGISKTDQANQSGFDMQKAVETRLIEIITSVKESIRTNLNGE